MPDTQASSGYGGTLELAFASNPTAYTYIHETRDFTLPNEQTATDDASHMQSPNKVQEFIDLMTDPGEISWDMNLVPGSESDRYLMSTRGKRLHWRYTFASGEQFIGIGVRTGYEKTSPHNGRMDANVTLKVSGEPFLTDVTAPRNLVEPVIDGAALVGAPLMIDPGVWAGALNITYQWKADGANIEGATGSSYVPNAGNTDAVITVEVTASNDDFTVTVETAGTDPVDDGEGS